jgi:hypothetical protein
MALCPELEGRPQLLRHALGRPFSGDHLGYANVQSKERFPHSHSLDGGCGIPPKPKQQTDVYTKYLTLPYCLHITYNEQSV